MRQYVRDRPELPAFEEFLAVEDMVFDRSVPEFTGLDEFACTDKELDSPEPDERRRLLPAVLASVSMHVIAAFVLVTFNVQREALPSPEAVADLQLRIRLSAPASPPAADPAAETPLVPATEPAAVAETARATPPAQPPARVTELPATDPPQTRVDLPAIEFSSTPRITEPNPDRPTLRLLSPQSLRQTIDGIAARRDASNALIHCTALQKESGLINCGEDDDLRDFSVLERNATHEFFATPDAPRQTRTQRTIGFMMARSAEVEQQLLASDIGGATVERFLSELRSTAEDVSATGNARIDRLKNEMYSNDSTYRQMQRAMNPR